SDEKVKTTIKKEDLKIGQKVKYHPIGSSVQLSEGIVKEIITRPEILGDAKEDVKEMEKEQEGEEPEVEEPEGEESDNESKDPNYDPAKGDAEEEIVE
ncbi:2830_t:CDS:2, partial [Racocetra fulgida]